MAVILQATAENIARMAREILRGELVAIPTETVYGLAADAYNNKAVAAIYAAKNRPAFNPLIAHYPDLEMLKNDVCWNERAQKLAQKFWPGALTMILPKTANSNICNAACAGLPNIAIRVPAHNIIIELLKQLQRPVVAPSANASGKLSPVCAEHVQKSLAREIKWIIDGGQSTEGLESTIIDISKNRSVILRLGTITIEQIKQIIPDVELIDSVAGTNDSKVIAPGMMTKHYAPTKPIRIVPSPDSQPLGPAEALLVFGDESPWSHFTIIYNLSPQANLAEAARNFFALLHNMDSNPQISSIAVTLLPNEAVGAAINDRIMRAVAASK